MRVMWFTNIPMPAMDRHMGIETAGSGGWMPSLLAQLRAQEGVEVAVVTAVPRQNDCRFSEDGVDYFVISESKPLRYGSGAGIVSKCVRGGSVLMSKYLPFSGPESLVIRRSAEIIDSWKPDVIHFHGTERVFGLTKAHGLTKVPAAVSIQGLLGPCSKKVFGGLSFREVLATHRPRELLLRGGAFGQRRQWCRGSKTEETMIRSMDAVLGRTTWDQAHAWRIDCDVAYYHVGEILRSQFYDARWGISKVRRHQIMVTNARSPMRGLETVLDALVLLRREFPDVKVCVAAGLSKAGGYGRFVRRRIGALGLADNIELLGFLTADELIAQLRNSHCYVIASYIENSPNSLCEAMMLGMPCVASFVGGIGSLMQPEHSGLMFPVGDESVLAQQIRRLFQDDDLAVRLGTVARGQAHARHDRRRVVGELLGAYKAIVNSSK